jgi:hypothetical protein
VDAIFTPDVGSPFALNSLRMDVSIDRVYEVVGMVDYPMTITLWKRLNSTICQTPASYQGGHAVNQRQQHGSTSSDDWQEKRKSRDTFDSAEDSKQMSSHTSTLRPLREVIQTFYFNKFQFNTTFISKP